MILVETALIFAGGDALAAGMLEDLPPADLTIAADGGYDVAMALGRNVDILIGDLDSIAGEIPDRLIVHRHRPDKDATDLELALELVQRHTPQRVIVIGGTGGRLDHEIAVVELLCSSRWSPIEDLDWLSPRGWGHVIRGRRIIHGDVGAAVSLIPVGGEALGVHTTGLRWELAGETIPHGSTRGVSNVMNAPVADIRVGGGCLLVVIPDSTNRRDPRRSRDKEMRNRPDTRRAPS